MKSIFHAVVPELPVKDVERSQAFYRDKFGFTIAWTDQSKTIGAVERDEMAVFFRQHEVVVPNTMWVFADNVDEMYKQLINEGVPIADKLEKKPWGLRQFTIEDIDGNRFIFHE